MQFLPGTFVWVKCEDGIWWPARIPEGVSEEEIRAVEPDKDTCVEFFHHLDSYYTVSCSDILTIQPMHFEPGEQSPSEVQWFANPAVQMAVKKAFKARFGSPLSMTSEEAPRLLSSRALDRSDESKNEPGQGNLVTMECCSGRDCAPDKTMRGSSGTKIRRVYTADEMMSSLPSHFTSEEKNHIQQLMRAIRSSTIKSALQNMPSPPPLSAPSCNGRRRLPHPPCDTSSPLSCLCLASLPQWAPSCRTPEDSLAGVHSLTSTTTGSGALQPQLATETVSTVHSPESYCIPSSARFDSSSLLGSAYSFSPKVLAADSPRQQITDSFKTIPERAGKIAKEILEASEEEDDRAHGEAMENHLPLAEDMCPLVMHYVPPVSRSVLQVVRSAVLDDSSRFVLSPVYRLLDVLGAVNVSSQSLTTNFPTPYAVRQVLKESNNTHENSLLNVCPTRRVLLFPLSCTEDGEYDHQMGWMQPTLLDNIVLEMRMRVNGSEVTTPQNWNIAAAKEKKAVRTAPTLDVTSLVMAVAEKNGEIHEDRSERTNYAGTTIQETLKEEDVFTLEVQFPVLPPSEEDNSLLLWEGLIVAIYVDTVPLVEIENRIIAYYRPPLSDPPSSPLTHIPESIPSFPPSDKKRRKRTRAPNSSTQHGGKHLHPLNATNETEDSAASLENPSASVGPIHVVRGTIGVHCPLTSTPMKTPVKGIYCEHLQCMELSAVLRQFTRSNIWNCPLCGEDMRPTAIWVHHRLRWWIAQRSLQELQRIEYVVENENNILVPHYSTPRAPSPGSMLLID